MASARQIVVARPCAAQGRTPRVPRKRMDKASDAHRLGPLKVPRLNKAGPGHQGERQAPIQKLGCPHVFHRWRLNTVSRYSQAPKRPITTRRSFNHCIVPLPGGPTSPLPAEDRTPMSNAEAQAPGSTSSQLSSHRAHAIGPLLATESIFHNTRSAGRFEYATPFC